MLEFGKIFRNQIGYIEKSILWMQIHIPWTKSQKKLEEFIEFDEEFGRIA